MDLLRFPTKTCFAPTDRVRSQARNTVFKTVRAWALFAVGSLIRARDITIHKENGADSSRNDERVGQALQSLEMRLVHLKISVFLLSLSLHPVSPGQASDSHSAGSKSNLEDNLRQADALQDKGELQPAKAIYNSVVQALNNGQPSAQLGHALNGLSNIASSEGNYQDSIELAGRADDVYRELNDAVGRAYALNNRGNAEGELGLYAAAQSHLRQALILSQTARDFETVVRTLSNLGNVYYYPGQYLEAFASYQSADSVLQQHSAEKWSEYWKQILKFNEATLYQRLGRYDRALEIYRNISETSKGLDESDRAHLQTNLGALYRRLGDSYKALDSYRSALDLYRRQQNSAGEISTIKNMGIVYALDRDDLARAQEFFQRTLSLAAKSHNQREQAQAHLYLGEALFRQGARDAARREFVQAHDQAQQHRMPEEQWKALYGLARIDELTGKLAQAAVEYRDAISIIETTRTQLQLSALRADFMADKRDAYDGLIALLLKNNDFGQAFQMMERSRARTFQDRLAPAENKTASTAVPTLDEAQSYLDPFTILLEFWVSGNRIALIWCTHERSGMAQTELKPDQLQLIFTFLRGLPDNLQGDWRQRTALLGKLLPDGFSPPASVRHVVIVPDGWLSTVPFELVNTPDRELLIDRFDVSYLPSAALFRRKKTLSKSLRWPWQYQVVAFGDPVEQHKEEQNNALETEHELQRLPYAAEEIKSIARLANGRVQTFTEEADRKADFLAGKASDAPLLHVASHAFADTDNPEGSRVEFSPADNSGNADYLFLRELYDLDLSDVDLATLSACDTERGKMIRGEGVQAFGRALLLAGSKSALTTLWRVDDQATKDFMKQFYYFAIQERQPKAEALRSAKLRFLHSGTALANPAHWAAFVLNGDGSDRVPQFLSWAEIAAIPAALVILSVVTALALSRHRRWVHRLDGSERAIAE